MPERPTLAYLTSAYARAADSFIRGEVEQLRKLGFVVHTFSVRRSGAHEATSEDIRREQLNTEYLLDGNLLGLLVATARVAAGSPGRFLSALGLAWRSAAPGIRGRIWSLAYLMEACFLARRLHAKGVRHLHNHLGENSAAVAMLASHLSDVPYSLTIHGPNEFDQPMLLALGQKMARAAFVVGVSEFGRSQLYRWCDYRHWGKIHVVHCGVDEHFLASPPATPPDEPRLVCIGRLSEAKGQLLLVEAVGRLKREGIAAEVTLIGDGPMRPALEATVERHGLQASVHLAGWMSAEGIRQEILRSRALVLPSFAEGLPVVLMEAMALHRPTLTTYVAGIPELVENEVNGWLIPAGSVEALVDGLKRVLATPVGRLAEMGQAGHERVARQHCAATEARKLAELFSGCDGG